MSKTILIDVDKTLINEKYEFTVDFNILKEQIRRAQLSNLSIGLNSDSALPTLRDIYNKLGMNGPIIAERGGVVLLNSSKDEFYTIEGAEVFLSIRQNLINQLVNAQPHGHFLVIIGNVNPICNLVPSYNNPEESPITAVLVNSLRVRSLSFYIREKTENGWGFPVKSLDLVKRLLLKILSDYSEITNYHIELNEEYGICIVHYTRTEKSIGVSAIQSMIPHSKFYMIGDSITDYSHLKTVEHAAVANATDEYKRKCSIVSELKYSEGVIDIIQRIEAI